VESPSEGLPGSVSRPRSEFRIRDLGCLLPILLAGLGLAVGWWTVGAWAGLGGWIVGGVLGLSLYAPLSRGSDFGPVGGLFLLVLLIGAMLIPAVHEVRKAAERMRTEHERKQQESSPPPEGNQK
jgi:hypothetical protein